jgi:ribose transport system substrate-binding protein
MSKKKIVLFLSFLTLFLLCYLVLNRSIRVTQDAKQTYEVSVICRSENTETWSTVKQGIDQAAKDRNVDVSFITLSGRNNAAEQVTLLNREVENGADAVVIAPVDSGSLVKPIADALKKIPVVAVQSTVTGLSGMETVSCDNAAMGKALAREVAKSGGSEVVVLGNSAGCSNVAASARAIESELKGRNVVFRNLPDEIGKAADMAGQTLAEHPGDTFVALDAETLEAVGQAKKDRKECRNSKIFGVGRTNKVVSFLEEGVVDAVAVENDYNMGYLCIQAAVDRIGRRDDGSPVVNYRIVSRSDMYRPENERILFPFVR